MRPTGRWARFIIPLLLLLSALACTLSAPASTPSVATNVPTRPPAALVETPLGGAPVAVAPPDGTHSFAPFPAVEADRAGALGWLGLPELANLANPADLWPLNEAQRTRLEELGFVVVPEPGAAADIYREAAADGRPLFLSADVVLQACITLYAEVWHDGVLPQLADDLAALVQTMRQSAETRWEDLDRGESPAERSLAEAARRNLAFLTVAQRLLDPAGEAHPAVAQMVEDEWTLLTRAEGEFASPISGVRIDYRAFGRAPAGALPGDPLLPAYRALQWFQLQPLPLSGSPGEMRRRAQRMLLYLAALEESQNQTRWARLDGALGYLWGGTRAFTPAELATIAGAVYGGVPDADGLADVEALDTFIRTLDQAGYGELRFFHVGDGPPADPEGIFRGLTFNRVGGYVEDVPEPLPPTAAETEVGVIRTVPRVLDVAAVHGSEVGLDLLEAGGETAYESYGTQFEGLREAAGNRPVATWTDTFRGGWHYALLPLLEPPLAAGPAFMRDDAWDRSRLSAWQAAWTLGQWAPPLETVQPEAVMAEVDVYLEPQPILYARLAALTRQQAAGLSARGLIDEGDTGRLVELASLLADLSAISADERQSTFWQPANSNRLREAVVVLSSLSVELPHVVDLYAAGDGRTLQTGVAGFYPVYVVAPWDTQHRVFAGAVWASFELIGEREERLTAEQWSALDVDEWPDRPAWTDAFVID